MLNALIIKFSNQENVSTNILEALGGYVENFCFLPNNYFTRFELGRCKFSMFGDLRYKVIDYH